MSKINEKIKQIRQAYNLSGKDFSFKIGISAPYLSEIESGKKDVTPKIIQALKKEFNISSDWLLFSESEFSLHQDFKKEENSFLNSFDANLLNDNFDKELEINYKKLSTLRNQVLTIVNYMKEKTDYNFSPKEIQMLNLVDDFLNDDTNGILRLMEDGRKQYNNALKQYILSTEEYLSMLIDYFKFEIKKPLKNFKELE